MGRRFGDNSQPNRWFNPRHNLCAGHRDATDVLNVNDCVVGEPETSATNAMTRPMRCCRRICGFRRMVTFRGRPF